MGYQVRAAFESGSQNLLAATVWALTKNFMREVVRHNLCVTDIAEPIIN